MQSEADRNAFFTFALKVTLYEPPISLVQQNATSSQRLGVAGAGSPGGQQRVCWC